MNTAKEAYDFLQRHAHDSFEQFGIDWIELTLDQLWDDDCKQVADDEATMRVLHGGASDVLQILRDDAKCKPFFLQLEERTKHAPASDELSESGRAWRQWFDATGAAASAEIVNATATLVITEREIYARNR